MNGYKRNSKENLLKYHFFRHEFTWRYTWLNQSHRSDKPKPNHLSYASAYLTKHSFIIINLIELCYSQLCFKTPLTFK
jgi:hypothetical protein